MTLLHTEKISEASTLLPEIWESVFTTPSGFMTTKSTRRTGTTEGGKNWSRFQEQSVTYFSMKSGKLRVYRKERRVPRDHRGRVSGRSKLGPIRDYTGLVVDMGGERWGSCRLSDIGADHLGFDSFEALLQQEFPLRDILKPSASGVLNLTRAVSLVDASKLILGKNYQKSVPRALARDVGPDTVNLRTSFAQAAMVFQGIVPTDWIADLFVIPVYGHRDVLFQTRDELRDLRRFLRSASQTQLRRLTRNPPENFQVLLRDTYRRGVTLEGVDFRNLNELHDNIAQTERASRRKAENMPIEYSGKAKKFLGELEDLTIVAPSCTEELFAWSSTMGNCISGYGRYAAKGETLLYAVMRGEKMVANMELDPKTGTIRQLLGKYNDSLDKPLSDAVKSRVLSVWPKANVNDGWE